MPPRPFPWPLAVGTDICSISRLRTMVMKRNNGPAHTHSRASQVAVMRRLISTLMTYDEIVYFYKRFLPQLRTPAGEWHAEWPPVYDHLAGRFAAKEAISKAFGGTVSRHQITILPQPASRPPLAVVHAEPRVMSPQQKLHLHKAFDFKFADLDTQASLVKFDPEPARVEDLEGQLVKLSISHDSQYATAVCIAPTDAASQADAPV
ncbi:uncharacterized protein IWZ02DRAFT_316371 [Phyllosticta citriasiana]|uniref:4'-phosphopantetheinyl transferase domain-containing protein n=1 Tax=Phyllosticta citriasiana TaxID=595635 RepID=A0ABR1L242_9PEZI